MLSQALELQEVVLVLGPKEFSNLIPWEIPSL